MLSSLNLINLYWYFFNQRKSLEFWSFLMNIRSSTNSFCHLLVAISVTCYIKSSFHGWLHAQLNDNLINISFSDMLLLWSIWNNIRRGLTSEWPFDKLIKLWLGKLSEKFEPISAFIHGGHFVKISPNSRKSRKM